MGPEKTQRIPVSVQFVAILIVEDEVAKNQQGMVEAIARTLITSLERLPYVSSVEAIKVREVEPEIKTGRTQ